MYWPEHCTEAEREISENKSAHRYKKLMKKQKIRE
jgi:hypothetical protein